MDDKRFDLLTRAFASNANRRSLIKGLLGLGGAAAIGTAVDESVDAARRPTPTPVPPKCPGIQILSGGVCVCPPNLTQCVPGGPTCCNDKVPVAPGYSECCDNACCQYPDQCVLEELCCPRLPDSGCVDAQGRCCTTLCEETPGGAECCPTPDFCPGGSESADLCCAGNTTCCSGGTNQNACIDLRSANACCIDADCDTPPDGSSPCAVGTCNEHTCSYTDCNDSTEICCPNSAGVYACRVGDECCLSNADCADTCEACVGYVCVDDPNTFPCGPTSDPDKFCCPGANYTICCPGAKGECCGFDDARDVTRACKPDGACCPLDTPYYCADSGTCCARPCIQSGGKQICCAEGDIGCNGACCDGTCLTDQTPNICCTTGLVCPITEGPDECCPNSTDYICCGNDGCTDTDTDNKNCGSCGTVCPGCSTCRAGICTANDNECEGTEVCCKNGDSFTCEEGPYCGCDDDPDCSGLTDPKQCKVGYCDAGTCKTRAAANTVVCHAAGESAICDPAVMCNGEAQSCPTPPLPPAGIDCGDCETCNGQGICVDRCPTGKCCADDFCADQTGECCVDGDCTKVDNCTPADCVNHICNAASICAAGESCCGTGEAGCTDTKTDSRNCGQCGFTCQGCTTCQDGVCKPSDDKCEGDDVCCPSGNTFACQAGPYCGCDHDSECAAFNDPTHCRVGVCNLGTCTTGPAPNTTICFGIGSICNPTVMCNGSTQECPGANYTPINTDCGQCAVCNGQGACNTKCTGAQDCCPTTDICVPDGSQCCSSVSDCPAASCDGLTHITYTCSDGYCHRHTESCGDNLFCTNDTCDAVNGCGHSPIPCTSPPFCFTGPGTCNEGTDKCDYTPVKCDAPPICFTGTGTCNPSTGICGGYTAKVCNTPPNADCYLPNGTCSTQTGECVYTKKATGANCGTCKECNADGICGPAADKCCGITCQGPCQVCDGTSGICTSGCSGSTPICSPTGVCVGCIASGDCPPGTGGQCANCVNGVCQYIPASSCPNNTSCCQGQCTAAGADSSTCPFCTSTNDCCTGCCHYAPSWQGCRNDNSTSGQRNGTEGHCHEPDSSFQTDYPCACYNDSECRNGSICCQSPNSPYHKPPITGLGVCVPASSCGTGTCRADFTQCTNDNQCCSGDCNNPSGTPNCGGSERSDSFCLGQTGATCQSNSCCVSGNCTSGTCRASSFARTSTEDCIPGTCKDLGYTCGTTDDGCGGQLDCGKCEDGSTCDEKSHQCVVECTPATCQAGQCGIIDDGCGATIDCGVCSDGSTCDDATHQCVTSCTPVTCADLGAACGSVDDGCGTALDCGACQDGFLCDDTLQCVASCTPTNCAQLGAQCGTPDDGCGTPLDCGQCTGYPNSFCNENSQCDCVPLDCTTVGTCGLGLDNGCGAPIDCPCAVICIDSGKACVPDVDICCDPSMVCGKARGRNDFRCRLA